MNIIEQVLAEVRAMRKQLETKENVEGLGAVSYKRAAQLLDVGLTEVKMMVKHSLLLTVVYAPGKHPKIPLSEIKRLTTLPTRPQLKPRVKSSRKKAPSSIKAMTPEETRAALKKL